MSEQNLTSTMQEMMAQMARMQTEVDSLKQRANVVSLSVQPLKSAVTTTRRNTLKRLGLALLGGAVTATALGAVPAVQARVIANPQTNGLANTVGMVILPPGVPTPTGTATGFKYGLITSSDTNALDLNNLTAGDTGVYGKGTFGVYGNGYVVGIYGVSINEGVRGEGSLVGVYGESNNNGVRGRTNSLDNQVGSGVVGDQGGGFAAGYFNGHVEVNGSVTKSSGSFKIDHPHDPINKYLYHSFVESPDMMNIYNGIATLNDQGKTTVEMPSWFEALNSDFRYQLTCLDQYAPVFISGRIKDRKFKIAGGLAGQEVSWMVTGIRQDEWAKAHRIPVEEDKTETEKGFYIHPELFGQPKEKSISSLMGK